MQQSNNRPLLAKISKTVYDGRVRKILVTTAVLSFFLFAFPIQKAFAKCSFLVQSTYTTADDIQITVNGLTPQKFYSLWVQKNSSQIPYISGNPKYVSSANSTFFAGKLALGNYGFEIIGKETADQKSKIVDNCLGKTSDGFSTFIVSSATAPIPGQSAVSWMLNGNTPPECIQDTRGTFVTKAECEKTISLNSPNSSNFPAVSPPCAAFTADGKCTAVDTAIGRISTEPQGFVRYIYSVVLGLAGGIALILIIIAGYKVMASGGNPEATKAAYEQLISAVVGLLFIIFAFVILQIIGVDILKIPGFSN